MKVLVCGGRDFNRPDELFAAMDWQHQQHGFTLVIHGGAKGADDLARQWAEDRDIPCLVYKANWLEHGRGAGPRRNQRMLDEGRPELVVAFPGGKGTADMVRRAHKAGIKVHEALKRST